MSASLEQIYASRFNSKTEMMGKLMLRSGFFIQHFKTLQSIHYSLKSMRKLYATFNRSSK